MNAAHPRSRVSATGRAVLAVLVLLLLVTAGCGTDDAAEVVDRETPQPTEAASPSPPPTPDPEPEPTEPRQTPEPTEPTQTPEPAEGEGTTTVSVYFAHEERGDPCGDVFAVSREVAAEDPIGEAVVALLEGPTPAERDEGYGGWFTEETAGMLLGYRTENGVTYVDFADLRPVIPNASTSCGSAALLAQLNETLGQFPGLGEPRYSINGDVDAFYEWLQLSP